MNRQLLLALQKRSNERLVELRTEDLPAIQEEIDEINKQLQEVADALANLEDDGEGDEGEGSGEDDEGGSSRDESSSGSGEGGEGRSGNPVGNSAVSSEQRQAAMSAIKSALSTRNAKSTKAKEKEIRSAFANFVVGNISEMEARGTLLDLQENSKKLEAEQKRLTSSFKLQNASKADKLELAQKQLRQQMEMTGRVVHNLEQQLSAAKRVYDENSTEVEQLVNVKSTKNKNCIKH